MQSRHKKRISPLVLILLIVLGVIVLALGSVAAYVAISAKTKPNVETHGFYTGSGSNTVPPITIIPSTDPNETTSPDPFGRKDDFYTCLIIGKDVVAMNTDVIMLASYDVKAQNVSIAQLPRDTYVEYNGTPHKINSLLYQYYAAAQRNGDPNPMQTGLADFTRALSQSFNTVIDYYVMLDCAGLRSIVDRLGGVEIDIPYKLDYDDPAQNLHIHLEKGLQTLTGEQAEQFVRFRHGYVTADIGRLDAQKLFISAFIKQFKKNINLNTVTGIATDIYNYVTTNVSLSNAIYFGSGALKLDLANIRMMTMQGAGIQDTKGIWYYVLNRATVVDIINTYFNVYNSPIPDAYFDIDRIFSDSSDAKISEIYEKSAEAFKDYVKNAEELDENGVQIPIIG